MNVSDDIVEKLQALLNKTTENGCTEAEAQAAMQAAQRLAIKHNLDLASVKVAGQTKDPIIETDRNDVQSKVAKTMRPHHLPVARVLQACFDIHVVWHSGGACCSIIGEKTDVALATYCWHWLDALFPKLYLAYIKRIGLIRTSEDNNVRRRSFYEGVESGIKASNRRQREDVKKSADGQRFALVLVKKDEVVKARLKDEFPGMRKMHSRPRDFHSGAFNNGHAAGQEIRLNGGLSNSTTEKLA